MAGFFWDEIERYLEEVTKGKVKDTYSYFYDTYISLGVEEEAE